MTLTTPVIDGTSLRSRTVAGELVLDNAVVDDAGQNVFGAVGDSPDAATVLGRLKAIATLLAAQSGSTDGIEGLLANLIAAVGTPGTETYVLASTTTLAAGAATAWVTVARGGYYFFDASFTGTAPSVKLQRLGADGTTALDVAIRSTAGAGADPIGIPSGAQVRLTNVGGGTLTAVSAVLA